LKRAATLAEAKVPLVKFDLRPLLVAALAALVAVLVLNVPVAPAQSAPTAAHQAIPVSPIHYLEFGESGRVSDDCAYFETHGTSGASAVAVNTSDVRITPCLTKAAFTTVSNGDTAETQYPTGSGNTAPTVHLRYGDSNGNGAWDAGEPLYVSTYTGSHLFGSASTTNFTIRLSATHGMDAGSFVFPNHPDRTAYATLSRVTSGSLVWTNPDNSAYFTGASTLYVLPVNSTLAKGATLPEKRVQIYPAAGVTTTSSPTTTTTSPTNTTTTSPTNTTTSTTTTTSSPTETRDRVTGTVNTPGPGVGGLLAAVAGAVAGIAWARRR
jgi:hypothetical protein